MNQLELTHVIEALLFVATAPLAPAAIAATVDAPEEDVLAALEQLRSLLAQRGIRLAELGGSYQLVTAPEAASTIERYLAQDARTELSKPALETLAIIIYRQPTTKAHIEEVRGVASEQIIRSLLQRGLIIEAGPSQQPGRPMTYQPSMRLLHHLGLTSLSELPTLEEILGHDHQA